MARSNALVLAGGGMRSAHSAGFLYALGTKLGITSPDLVIGSSGAAGGVLYYSAGQYESMKRIWEGLLSTPKFISPLRFWKVMDVDYAVDEIFKKQEPLDTQQVMQSPIRWLISVTDFTTGATRYVGKEDKLDPFEILRASKAIPLLYGKKVHLGEREYIDGELGPTLEDHIRHALNEGARSIVAINDGNDASAVRRILMNAYTAHLSPNVRHAVLRDVSTHSICLTAPDANIICMIGNNLPAQLATRDKQKLTATFDKGIADALALESELRSMFPTVS